jgi:hypothetical protein
MTSNYVKEHPELFEKYLNFIVGRRAETVYLLEDIEISLQNKKDGVKPWDEKRINTQINPKFISSFIKTGNVSNGNPKTCLDEVEEYIRNNPNDDFAELRKIALEIINIGFNLSEIHIFRRSAIRKKNKSGPFLMINLKEIFERKNR